MDLYSGYQWVSILALATLGLSELTSRSMSAAWH